MLCETAPGVLQCGHCRFSATRASIAVREALAWDSPKSTSIACCFCVGLSHHRGRELGCPSPPAQIRTCALTHPAPTPGVDDKPLARPPLSASNCDPTPGGWDRWGGVRDPLLLSEVETTAQPDLFYADHPRLPFHRCTTKRSFCNQTRWVKLDADFPPSGSSLQAFPHKHLSQHKKTDLWAQKGTVKAVILFPRFDVAHIHQQCRATICHG